MIFSKKSKSPTIFSLFLATSKNSSVHKTMAMGAGGGSLERTVTHLTKRENSKFQAFFSKRKGLYNEPYSGQISIIPKPELRGFGGDSVTKPPFGVTSAEVAIVCRDLIFPEPTKKISKKLMSPNCKDWWLVTSWWLNPTPLKKYDRQNGFIFPNFRGAHSKNTWNNHHPDEYWRFSLHWKVVTSSWESKRTPPIPRFPPRNSRPYFGTILTLDTSLRLVGFGGLPLDSHD